MYFRSTERFIYQHNVIFQVILASLIVKCSIQFNSNPLFLEGNPISNAFLPRGLLTYIQYIHAHKYHELSVKYEHEK